MKTFIVQGVNVPWDTQKNVNTDFGSVVSTSALIHHLLGRNKGRKKEVVIHITYNVSQNIKSV